MLKRAREPEREREIEESSTCVRQVASAMTSGTSTSLASVLASSVLPDPVGPTIMTFVLSSTTGSTSSPLDRFNFCGSCTQRQYTRDRTEAVSQDKTEDSLAKTRHKK